MAYCPFCQTPVPTNLVTYGGPCPKCFGMIPGEEAPTDPGEAVKKAIANADDKLRKNRQSAPLFVAVPLVLITCLVAVGYALWPAPTVEPIVFDGELDMGAVPVAYQEARPEAPQPVVAAAPGRPGPTNPQPAVGGRLWVAPNTVPFSGVAQAAVTGTEMAWAHSSFTAGLGLVVKAPAFDRLLLPLAPPQFWVT